MYVLIPVAVLAMIVLIVWISNTTQRRETEQRAELMRRLIDKYSSGEAFAQSLRTPEGRMLVDALSLGKKDDQCSPLGLFTGGSITACLGIGFLVLSRVQDPSFFIPGAIVLPIGVALLVSSWVAWRAQRDAARKIQDLVHGRSQPYGSDGGESHTNLP